MQVRNVCLTSIILIEPSSQSVKREPVTFEEDFNFQNNVSVEEPTVHTKKENGDSDVSIVEQFSPMTTLMCDDQSIETVCAVIGSLASHWGYFERESIYLISKRLEIFFQNSSDTALGKQFVYLPISHFYNIRLQTLHG